MPVADPLNVFAVTLFHSEVTRHSLLPPVSDEIVQL